MNVAGESYLTHVTVAGNTENAAGGIRTGGGGKVFLRNTIVAVNSSPECSIEWVVDGNNYYTAGDISGIGNVTSDGSCNLWPGPPDLDNPSSGYN